MQETVIQQPQSLIGSDARPLAVYSEANKTKWILPMTIPHPLSAPVARRTFLAGGVSLGAMALSACSIPQLAGGAERNEVARRRFRRCIIRRESSG